MGFGVSAHIMGPLIQMPLSSEAPHRHTWKGSGQALGIPRPGQADSRPRQGTCILPGHRFWNCTPPLQRIFWSSFWLFTRYTSVLLLLHQALEEPSECQVTSGPAPSARIPGKRARGRGGRTASSSPTPSRSDADDGASLPRGTSVP